MLIPTIVTGVGIPTFSAWLSGEFPTSVRDSDKIKKIIIGSVVGIMVAGLAFMATAQPPPAAVARASLTAPFRRSVSDVTAQLGRYAGGIDYPGQITGSTGTDGSLIFVD